MSFNKLSSKVKKVLLYFWSNSNDLNHDITQGASILYHYDISRQRKNPKIVTPGNRNLNKISMLFLNLLYTSYGHQSSTIILSESYGPWSKQGISGDKWPEYTHQQYTPSGSTVYEHYLSEVSAMKLLGCKLRDDSTQH